MALVGLLLRRLVLWKLGWCVCNSGELVHCWVTRGGDYCIGMFMVVCLHLMDVYG